jgi:hypothetical protein
MTDFTITLQRSPTFADAECRRRLAAAYDIILAASRRAVARKAADDSNPSREAPSAVSTSDVSRCQHQFTPKLARAQVAEG